MLGVGVQSSFQTGCEQTSRTAGALQLGILGKGLKKDRVMNS